MKKFLCLVLAFIMALSMGVPVLATVGGTSPGGGWFTVGPGETATTTPEGYTIVRVERGGRVFVFFALPGLATIMREDVPDGGPGAPAERFRAGVANTSLPRGVNPQVGDTFWQLSTHPDIPPFQPHSEAQLLSVLPDGWEIIPVSDERVSPRWYRETVLDNTLHSHVFFVDLTNVEDETEFFRIRWNFEFVTLGDQRTANERFGVHRPVWQASYVVDTGTEFHQGPGTQRNWQVCTTHGVFSSGNTTRPSLPFTADGDSNLAFRLAHSQPLSLHAIMHSPSASCTALVLVNVGSGGTHYWDGTPASGGPGTGTHNQVPCGNWVHTEDDWAPVAGNRTNAYLARYWNWATSRIRPGTGAANSGTIDDPRHDDPHDGSANPLVFPPSRPDASWYADWGTIADRNNNLDPATVGPYVSYYGFTEDDLENARPNTNVGTGTGGPTDDFGYVIPARQAGTSDVQPAPPVGAGSYSDHNGFFVWGAGGAANSGGRQTASLTGPSATFTYPVPTGWMPAGTAVEGTGNTGHFSNYVPLASSPPSVDENVRTDTGTVHATVGSPTVWPTLYGRGQFNHNTPNVNTGDRHRASFVLEYIVPMRNPTHIPTDWRVSGWSEAGTTALFGATGQRYLNESQPMRGDSTNREMLVTPAMFNWERRQGTTWVAANPNTLTGIDVNEPLAMRMSHLAGATVVTNRTSGMNGTIRDVEFAWLEGLGEDAGMAIRVRTPRFMTRTGNTDVEFDLSFRQGGRTTLIGRVSLVVGNERLEVFRDDESIEPNHRQYLRAEETVRNVEIYAGEGVTITRNITGAQSVYVAAELRTDDAFDQLFRDNPELVNIIDMHHNGMNVANARVHIEPNSRHYVFNANREFIGTTGQNNLPFSTRYYISSSRTLNLGGAQDSGSGSGGGGGGSATTGDGAPGPGSTNVNHNPGTGQ